jgi:prevent-host-death family protein
MIKTLRESKAKLSELVELASKGEDVLITVRGKVKAKLTRIPDTKQHNRKIWLKELQTLQQKYATGKTALSIENILEETREERF